MNPKKLLCISGKFRNFFSLRFWGESEGRGREKPPGIHTGFKTKNHLQSSLRGRNLGIFDRIESPGANKSQLSRVTPPGTSQTFHSGEEPGQQRNFLIFILLFFHHPLAEGKFPGLGYRELSASLIRIFPSR